MKLKCYSADGTESHIKDFPDIPCFKDDKGIIALNQAVSVYRTNKRFGNVSTKTRGEVSGGGRKPWRQKGTGNARVGSRRSPIWRGGGIVFGPNSCDYRQKLNKKVKQLAFKRAFFERTTAGDLKVIEKLYLPNLKTRFFNQIIEEIVPEGKVLIIDDELSKSTYLSIKNIKRVFVVEASSVNAYDLCLYDQFIITEKGISVLIERSKN